MGRTTSIKAFVLACLTVLMSATQARAATPATMPSTQPLTFEGEVAASKAASDRDEKVEHLRRAVALRPGDQANLVYEFEMGVLLSQHTPTRYHEAMEVFVGIVERYDPRAYYRIEPEDSFSSPQPMIPQAAIHAAALVSDRQKGREYALTALRDLNWTFQKRKADWQNAPKPTGSPLFGGSREQQKLQSRVTYWEQRKAQAAAGSITLLGPYGKVLIDAALRQYIGSYGSTPPDMPKIMGEIIREFPDTPIAAAAQARIDQTSSPASRPTDPVQLRK